MIVNLPDVLTKSASAVSHVAPERLRSIINMSDAQAQRDPEARAVHEALFKAGAFVIARAGSQRSRQSGEPFPNTPTEARHWRIPLHELCAAVARLQSET
jgi:hypothetical protein